MHHILHVWLDRFLGFLARQLRSYLYDTDHENILKYCHQPFRECKRSNLPRNERVCCVSGKSRNGKIDGLDIHLIFSSEFDVYDLIYMIRIRIALYHFGHRIAECQTQALFILFHFVEY